MAQGGVPSRASRLGCETITFRAFGAGVPGFDTASYTLGYSLPPLLKLVDVIESRKLRGSLRLRYSFKEAEGSHNW